MSARSMSAAAACSAPPTLRPPRIVCGQAWHQPLTATLSIACVVVLVLAAWVLTDGTYPGRGSDRSGGTVDFR